MPEKKVELRGCYTKKIKRSGLPIRGNTFIDLNDCLAIILLPGEYLQ